MTLRLLVLVACFLPAACVTGTLARSDPRPADADTDADMDTDTDTDSDADGDADADADADPQPQVDCGPWEPPGAEGSVWSGAGSLDMTANWIWSSCEVERRFVEGGTLDCELLWSVEGEYYDWDERAMTAWYELSFRADEEQSTCEVTRDERRFTLYYQATFDWERGRMPLARGDRPEGPFEDLATAEIREDGRDAPFTYVSGLGR